jgi:hypothetical protein
MAGLAREVTAHVAFVQALRLDVPAGLRAIGGALDALGQAPMPALGPFPIFQVQEMECLRLGFKIFCEMMNVFRMPYFYRIGVDRHNHCSRMGRQNPKKLLAA